MRLVFSKVVAPRMSVNLPDGFASGAEPILGASLKMISNHFLANGKPYIAGEKGDRSFG